MAEEPKLTSHTLWDCFGDDLKAGMSVDAVASNGRSFKVKMEEDKPVKIFDLAAAKRLKCEANMSQTCVNTTISVLRDLNIPIEPNIAKRMVSCKDEVAAFYSTTHMPDCEEEKLVVYNHNPWDEGMLFRRYVI